MPAPIRLSERDILKALDAVGGLKSAAAVFLGVSPATLRKQMKALSIPYVWQPSERRRLIVTHEIDVTLAALSDTRFTKSQRRILDEGNRAENINEPRLLSETETRELIEEWKHRPAYVVSGKIKRRRRAGNGG